jgi:2-polyprenyl-3-methyl-5-hydroxy-6-metoxy-1,4-benzoquinol methylase
MTAPSVTGRAWLPQLQRRSHRLELLDAAHLDTKALWKNLDELAKINTLLGGYGPTLRALRQLVQKTTSPLAGAPWYILDVGCGGGDTLAQIYHWAQREHVPVKLTGLDLLPECIAYARKNYGHLPIEWVQADYAEYSQTLSPQQFPDIITSALFCHHLSEAQLHHFLQWMPTVARAGFVINDLHRHPMAYYGIDALTRLIPGCSELVKNDGRLSVWRGFHRAELEQILAQTQTQAQSATLHTSLEWSWAFRWLVIGYV